MDSRKGGGTGSGWVISDLCARLGLTTDVLRPAAHTCWSPAPSAPGAGHVVSLFEIELDTRSAFVAFRRSDPGPGPEAWAKLTRLTVGRDLRRVCWFGTPAASGHQVLPVRLRWPAGYADGLGGRQRTDR
ncbi:MAG: hypothetical protein M3450_06750 [Actinomycetota bacterium]|nr:hypothetical protein [Actinomycetota bacterium]